MTSFCKHLLKRIMAVIEVVVFRELNKMCCVSSGYLKKHHSTLFHPGLPLHKLHSVQRLGFGTNNKIFVEFDSPWWDTDCEVIYFLWEDEVSFVDSI